MPTIRLKIVVQTDLRTDKTVRQVYSISECTLKDLLNDI